MKTFIFNRDAAPAIPPALPSNGSLPDVMALAVPPDFSLLSSIQHIRARARQHIEDGAVTGANGEIKDSVIKLLNEALATELVCVLRYKRHYYTAKGIRARFAAQEFLEHATEEAAHADMIADRINQLGGAPDFNPDSLSLRSHAEYDDSQDLKKMLEEDLVAERIAIESYSEMIRFIGAHDPTTRVMLESILGSEERHADDLAELLQEFK